MHQARKRRKTQAGSMLLRKGNTIMQNVAPSKLVIVENGIMLGSTISGIYSHTTGPSVNPKISIKMNIEAIIIYASNPPCSLLSCLRRKAKAIKAKHAPQTAVPSCIKNFLPFLAITLIVRTDIKAGKEQLSTTNKSIAFWLLTTSVKVCFP